MSKENLEGRAEKTLRDTDTYRVPVAIDIVAQRLNLTMSAAPLGEKVSRMRVVLRERGAIEYNSAPRRPDHARQPHTVRASACLVAVEFRDNPEPGVGAASALWLTYRHPYKDNRTTDTLPHPPVPRPTPLGSSYVGTGVWVWPVEYVKSTAKMCKVTRSNGKYSGHSRRRRRLIDLGVMLRAWHSLQRLRRCRF